MYHYINGFGKIWVGIEPPPEETLNLTWLHPTTSGSPLWELLAFDCNQDKWVLVGGQGEDIPEDFEATVDQVESTSQADASVTLDGNIFKFRFGLPKGSDGAPGPPGKDGTDGKDGADGKPGVDGSDGTSIRIMYSKTSTPDTPPIVVKDNTNPGSIWGNVVPIHTTSDSIWSITATFKDTVLIGEWSDPLLMTGTKGDKGDQGEPGPEGPEGPAGTTPNYKTYIYKLSNTKPDPPTGTNPNPEGWEDYPTTSGNWWQCIGTVTGSTGLVSEWSEVLPVNGRDGTAQDGKYTEFRFAINFSNITPPALDKTMRTPTGWSMTPAVKATQEFMWMIVATINPDDTLYTNWSTPTVISGEAGPEGPSGEDGIQGPPGADGRTTYFHIKYSDVPSPTSASQMTETPSAYIGTYVDFTQLDSNNPSDYTWARFEGLQGEKGEQGIPGINGEDGQTSYLHIKYSNDGGATFTGNTGEDVGSWIGTYVDFNIEDSDNPSDYKWVKIKGDDGEPGPAGNPGPAGKDGVSGIPGVGIEVQYCLGTESTYTGSTDLGANRNPTGWSTTVPTVTEANPYIWFIQARINYEDNSDRVGSVDGAWSIPTKLSGTNGLDGAPGTPGAPGSKGQIVYPEGIYSTSTTYVCDEHKAPYVYDSGDANYYVLNKVGTWLGTEHSNQTPSTDTSGSWLRIDAAEAIFTKILLAGTALVGSAVFIDEWMFSQQGIDANGQVSTNYEAFDPTNPTAGVFTPNIAFNFETGEGFLAAGKIKFEANGNLIINNSLLGNNVIQAYEEVTMDSPTITKLYSSIGVADTTLTFQYNLSTDVENLLEADKFYSGAIINETGFDQIITGVSIVAPGDRLFSDEGDIKTTYCTQLRLGAGCIFSYTLHVNYKNASTTSITLYPQNASDFLIISNADYSVISLASKAIGASLPTNNIARGRITMQGTGSGTIFIDYSSIHGITLGAHSVRGNGNKYKIKIPINGRCYPYRYRYKCDAQQTFDITSMWDNTPWCEVRVDTSEAGVEHSSDNTGNSIGIVIDLGGFTPSKSHEILIDFVIWFDNYNF